jgi:uncharacterized protein (DUF362 family)
MPRLSRREFLGAAATTTLLGCRTRKPPTPAGCDQGPSGAEEEEESALRERALPPAETSRDNALAGIRRAQPRQLELIVAKGQAVSKMVRPAVEELGGVRRFVSRGDRVVLSPNFAWARPAELGITTHPDVVREMIFLCQESGAQDIVCLDYSTDATPRAYRVNGALRAVEGTKARLLSPWSPEQYVRVGDFLRWPVHARQLRWQAVASVLLSCDVLISMPVFKHHREVGVTGAVKKMMGCVWRRAAYHKAGLDHCIAELGCVLRPTLVVTDGGRILGTNGPEGPGQAISPGRLLVSTDPVLADAYACRWLKIKPETIAHLREADRLGAGRLDMSATRVDEITVT